MSHSTLNDKSKYYIFNRWLLRFKKINGSAFSGRRQQRWSVMMSPAVLKSEEPLWQVVVPGISMSM